MDLGRASFGGWELGPPSASEMAPDLETSPATLQTPQYPALQYLHKTAQYAEWGSYNICACPPLSVYLQSYVWRGGDLAGEQTRAATDLGRCSVLRQDMGRHYAPGAGHPFFKISLFQELLQSKKM